MADPIKKAKAAKLPSMEAVQKAKCTSVRKPEEKAACEANIQSVTGDCFMGAKSAASIYQCIEDKFPGAALFTAASPGAARTPGEALVKIDSGLPISEPELAMITDVMIKDWAKSNEKPKLEVLAKLASNSNSAQAKRITATLTAVKGGGSTPAGTPSGVGGYAEVIGNWTWSAGITDTVGNNTVETGSHMSRYSGNKDRGGLTESLSAGTLLGNGVRLGIKLDVGAMNPYNDPNLDPLIPHLSRTSLMGVLGYQTFISPKAFVGADALLGGVKTSADEADEKVTFATSDMMKSQSTYESLNKTAMTGGYALRTGYHFTSNFYGTVNFQSTWDALSSDPIKNPYSNTPYFIQTKGATLLFGVGLGVGF